ncbi:hypothetical protein [Vibrio vulnificus]|uniref:hypothetical protein n=1 Tax=Vibrio vulnificus TaxID=672 RepID=UPI0009B61AAA|nr:hypothetical protein [Vibrio vulnificus]EGQ8002280.1 hypothetical protein [Vibrio vulnificus]EGQ9313422.1 hypothetical protein [Vibrio vulnificus]EIY8044409.1 hypothetical protein [Vibrio vulnificus]OQK42777.1 hypothetical protein XM72_c11669 [Vibrio vulnificus]OUD79056.1 hypothetical protein XM73_c11622 [Vibrio vulnificus]
MGNYQKILAVLTPYSLVVSLLYLSGYWSSFDVNILEYIAISDVIKSALTPLLYALIFVAFGVVLGNAVSVPLAKYMPPGGGRHHPSAKYFRAMLWIGLGFLLIAVCYVIFFQSGGSRWLRVAAFSMVFMPFLIGDASFAKGYLKHDQLRILVVNILASLSLYSFGWGAIDAQSAKSEGHQVSINGKETELTYVGWAGDFLFLWDQSKNSIVARSKSSIQSLEKVVSSDKPLISLLDPEPQT